MKATEEGTAEIRHLDLRRVREHHLQVADALYEEGEPTSPPIMTYWHKHLDAFFWR